MRRNSGAAIFRKAIFGKLEVTALLSEDIQKMTEVQMVVYHQDKSKRIDFLITFRLLVTKREAPIKLWRSTSGADPSTMNQAMSTHKNSPAFSATICGERLWRGYLWLWLNCDEGTHWPHRMVTIAKVATNTNGHRWSHDKQKVAFRFVSTRFFRFAQL